MKKMEIEVEKATSKQGREEVSSSASSPRATTKAGDGDPKG